MRVWLPVCLLFGGCAQLAGIDDTSGEGRLGLSLAVERVSIGTTIERSPQDLSANTATFLLDPPVAAVEVEPGTWAADVFDATPAVVFDLPDNPPPIFDRQIALPSKNLLTSFDVLEHPDAVAGSTTDTLALNVTLDTVTVATETFQLFIVGTWTARAIELPVVGSPSLASTFEIGSMTSLTGRPHEAISLADTPVVIRRNGATLTGVFEPAPFVQVTGVNNISGAITAVVADQMVNAQIDQAAATARLGVARPAITVGPAFSFEVTAAPGGSIGNSAGPSLTSGLVGAMDVAITAQFANPFASKGWSAVLTYTAAGSRTLIPTGETLPVTLSAGMQQLADDPQAVAALDFPAPVPEQVSIDGTSLSLDNVSIAQPVAPVEIAVVVDTAGVSLFSLEVRELVANGAALEPVLELSAVSDTPSFTIQPEVFEPGKLYSLRVRTISGLFGGVADGDLQTRSLPFATAFVDAGIFRVTP